MSSAALIIFSERSCKRIYSSTSKKSGKPHICSALAQIITDSLLHVSDVLFVCDSAGAGCTNRFPGIRNKGKFLGNTSFIGETCYVEILVGNQTHIAGGLN